MYIFQEFRGLGVNLPETGSYFIWKIITQEMKLFIQTKLLLYLSYSDFLLWRQES